LPGFPGCHGKVAVKSVFVVFRHLSEAKTQLTELKAMLNQYHAMQQHVSEPVDVGNRPETAVGGPVQPATVLSTGADWNSQWYDHPCLFSTTVILTFTTFSHTMYRIQLVFFSRQTFILYI